MPIPTRMTTEATVAVARSRIYQSLVRSFTMPDGTMSATLISDSERRAVSEALSRLPVHFDAMHLIDKWDDICKSLSQFPDALELQQEYLRIFEASEKRALCPLYESFYRKEERRDTMAELVRFYNFFGLTLGERAKEMPDHLLTELEFLHYVSFLETQALEAGVSVVALVRAEHDFLERHLLLWLPHLCQRLLPLGSEHYLDLAQTCLEFVKSDCDYLRLRGIS